MSARIQYVVSRPTIDHIFAYLVDNGVLTVLHLISLNPSAELLLSPLENPWRSQPGRQRALYKTLLCLTVVITLVHRKIDSIRGTSQT